MKDSSFKTKSQLWTVGDVSFIHCDCF